MSESGLCELLVSRVYSLERTFLIINGPFLGFAVLISFPMGLCAFILVKAPN